MARSNLHPDVCFQKTRENFLRIKLSNVHLVTIEQIINKKKKKIIFENDKLHKCVVKYWKNGDKNESKLKSGV